MIHQIHKGIAWLDRKPLRWVGYNLACIAILGCELYWMGGK